MIKDNFLVSEKQLFFEISEGSESAFQLIFKRYHKRMLSFVYSFVKTPYAAEEIVQESFIRLWENRDLLVEVKNPADYLFIIVRNHMLNYLRKIANDEKLMEQLWNVIEKKTAYVELPLETKENEYILQSILKQLSPQKQKIFRMSRYLGLSHKEIAAQLHLSRNTVKNHLVESLQMVKTQLQQSGTLSTIIFLLLIIN